ncbi:MAG TPA: hypothetical protein VJS45_11250, partial [Acidimicrobiia bacterium]|nr:hypothetical protein [Acidimicrobiia bacterium]
MRRARLSPAKRVPLTPPRKVRPGPAGGAAAGVVVGRAEGEQQAKARPVDPRRVPPAASGRAALP